MPTVIDECSVYTHMKSVSKGNAAQLYPLYTIQYVIISHALEQVIFVLYGFVIKLLHVNLIHIHFKMLTKLHFEEKNSRYNF